MTMPILMVGENRNPVHLAPLRKGQERTDHGDP